MSRSEIERFVADLKSNPDLRAEVATGKPDTAQTIVSFAVSKGYDFTVEEAAAFAAGAKAKPGEKRLTDAELDGVVGGIQPPSPYSGQSPWYNDSDFRLDLLE